MITLFQLYAFPASMVAPSMIVPSVSSVIVALEKSTFPSLTTLQTSVTLCPASTSESSALSVTVRFGL